MRGYLLGVALVCACCSTTRKPHPPAPAAVHVTVFATGELRGQLEPCGCTTEPMGDLARIAQLVTDARAKGRVIVLDGGSTLYSQPAIRDQMKAQEERKADLVAHVLTSELKVEAAGLGPNDLAGAGGPRFARQCANLPAGGKLPVEAPKVIDADGAAIGVFGVTDPDALPGLGATDATAAASQAVATLRGGHARVVIALATMDRKAAAKLLREVHGIDLMILDLGPGTPEPDHVKAQAEKLGETWVITPTDRGQMVSQIEITVRDGAGLADAVGAGAAAGRTKELTARLAVLDDELKKFAADPTADKDFVAREQAERDRVAGDIAALAKDPDQIPASGSYFQLTQIPIVKTLACDAEVVTAKQAFDRDNGLANLEAAKATPAPPVAPGQATYVGVEACADCHADQVAKWRETRHAHAYETIEQVGKQYDYECVECHVTGFGQPGGATLAANELLRGVQCETCHGPGSLHVAADPGHEKTTIQRKPADGLCAGQCHTPIHSDTFDHDAYLRDIVGPGHAPERRKQLGDGPTGHELRAAGLARASKSIGARCPK